MAFQRSNVYGLGGDWADPILWYARAVAEAQKRPITDRTSWRFLAAMHGINTSIWHDAGYLAAGEKLPAQPEQHRFWKQCQHGTWYFLPWHRGYLLSFEAIMRDAIVKLGGPNDWALPYWRYFKHSEAALPPAFASPDWPDGKGNNPLFVPLRFGPNNDGNVFVELVAKDYEALNDKIFTGLVGAASEGFGGGRTGFNHSAHNKTGAIENSPHNVVHGQIGGSNQAQTVEGLMSDPDTAALDPIFWIHHSNIDRLWAVWNTTLNQPNAPDDHWLKGPAGTGGHVFVVPNADGTERVFVPHDMLDLATLQYTYQEMDSEIPIKTATQRLENLGISHEKAVAGAEPPEPQVTELVGASPTTLKFTGPQLTSQVDFNPSVADNVAKSLTTASLIKPGDEVYLHVENVKSRSNAVQIKVYVGLPEGQNPQEHPEHYAGTLGLFGAKKASDPSGEHGGAGTNYTLRITSIIDHLFINKNLSNQNISVQLVSSNGAAEKAGVTIGRLSIYREGQ